MGCCYSGWAFFVGECMCSPGVGLFCFVYCVSVGLDPVPLV
jgi:hypothetical protein